MTYEQVYALTSANRLMIADLLDSLDNVQWRSDTLCRGWTVHHMAAHLIQPMVVGFGQFFRAALRHRGNTDATVDHVTRRLARRPRAELVALLRQHSHDRVNPPRVGPMGPFADTCLHLRDIARPLRLDADVPLEQWRILLDHLCSPGTAPALVPGGRLDGLAVAATDIDWSIGSGDLVTGPAEAVAMAVTGRRDALTDLHGPGVHVLDQRLRPR